MAGLNFIFRNSKYILNVCDCFLFCESYICMAFFMEILAVKVWVNVITWGAEWNYMYVDLWNIISLGREHE